MVLGDSLECRNAVRGLHHVVAKVLQELAEQGDVRRFVVHGEDQRSLASHGRNPSTVLVNVAKSMGLLM